MELGVIGRRRTFELSISCREGRGSRFLHLVHLIQEEDLTVTDDITRSSGGEEVDGEGGGEKGSCSF